MKHCDKCHLDVATKEEFCPLCQSNLIDIEMPGAEVFPYVPTIYKKYHKFFKFLYFICASVTVISVLINILLLPQSRFSFLVFLGVVCFLLILKIALTYYDNMPRITFLYVLVLSLLSILWDTITGYRGWSLSFAIPIICLVGSTEMAIVVTIMNIYISEYLIYYLVIGILGLIPLLFLLFSIVSTDIPSLICVFFNTLVLLGLFFLQKEQVLTEIKRRFHV
ncbi:MAG: DUF6320 domain-containing protein [Bacilli bacterium]|nr:DUF6320 domain-containing protein [Bacilli bacterium]